MSEKILLICGSCDFAGFAIESLKKEKKIDLFVSTYIEKEKFEFSSSFIEKNIFYFSIFNISKLLKYCKNNNIKKISFAGKFDQNIIKKKIITFSKKFPFFNFLGKDFFSLKILIDILISYFFKKKILGDDGLSRILLKHIQKTGMSVIGIHELIPDLIISSSDVEKYGSKINKNDEFNIKFGFDCADSLSFFDVGQSNVVGNKKIIGIEGQEGTDELIKRCSVYSENNKLILVKTNKKKQTRKIDFATLGIETLKNLAKYNYYGLAIKKSETIIIDKELFFSFAKKQGLKIFILS